MESANPILVALAALEQGQDLDHLMVLREQHLPTPQAWLDAGWDALAHLKDTEETAQWIAQIMLYAWQAAGPVGKCARASWTQDQARGAQGLWQQQHLTLRNGAA